VLHCVRRKPWIGTGPPFHDVEFCGSHLLRSVSQTRTNKHDLRCIVYLRKHKSKHDSGRPTTRKPTGPGPSAVGSHLRRRHCAAPNQGLVACSNLTHRNTVSAQGMIRENPPTACEHTSRSTGFSCETPTSPFNSVLCFVCQCGYPTDRGPICGTDVVLFSLSRSAAKQLDTAGRCRSHSIVSLHM
jgi:hypothetical protein